MSPYMRKFIHGVIPLLQNLLKATLDEKIKLYMLIFFLKKGNVLLLKILQ